MAMATAEADTASCGAPCRLERFSQAGACPALASAHSIRLLANRTLLPADNTAVMATNVSTFCAAGSPARCKTTMNGLVAGSSEFHGNSIMTIASEPKSAFNIARPNACGETIPGRVRELNEFLFVLERHDDAYRPKDFFLSDLH